MKYSLDTLAIMTFLFISVELFGLFVINHYYSSGTLEEISAYNVKKEEAPYYLLFSILFLTAIFLILQKIKMEIITKLWFFSAVFGGMYISLNAILGSFIAITLSAILVYLRWKYDDNSAIHNLTEILIYGGIITLIITSFDILSGIILLILISAYDVFSVFFSKHMIKLAKLQNKMGIFAGLKIINRNEIAILGGGDLAFTLLFSGVALISNGISYSIITMFGALFGFLILIIKGKKGKFYPAMPFLTAGMLTFYLFSLLL